MTFKRFIYLFMVFSLSIILISCNEDNTITYTIKIDLNYDSSEKITEIKVNENEQIINLEETLSNILNRNERTGYRFVGWSLSSDSFEEFNIETIISSNYTIYAFWIKTYTLSFDGNGVTCTIPASSYDENETINVWENKLTRFKYIFLGWSENADGVGTIYNNDNQSLVIKKDTTLYAIWKIDESLIVPEPVIDREIESTYLDITYKIVNNTNLKLDIYLPKIDEKKSPIVFFFFGGGWFMGDKKDITTFKPIMEKLINDGMAVCAINYRLADSNVKFPEPVKDCLDGIRFIVKYAEVFGVDTDNMGSIGPSAGGHLALMTGFAQDFFIGATELSKYKFKLKFVVDLFGPAVFSSNVMDELSVLSKSMLYNFIGTSDFQNKCIDASPSNYLDYNNPKVLIIHGLEDSIVPSSQSVKLLELMQSRNIDAKLILVEGAEHVLTPAEGFTSISPSLSELYDVIYNFLKEQIK